MKAAPFLRHVATSVDDAVQLLSQVAPDDGRVIAGGQTLIPTMALRLARPPHLVDINGVPEFQQLEVVSGELVIGACVRHAAFHRAAVDGPLGALLAEVVRNIAHLPIRHRGTFCGSLANADPASEWCLVAATLDATVVAQSVRGARDIPARDFLLGFMTTALQADEILTAVRIPLLPASARFGFVEFSRRAGDFAQAAALAVLNLEDSRVLEARLGIGGVEAAPRRIAEAEVALVGQNLSETAIRSAAKGAAQAVEPMEGDEEGLAYKRDLTEAAMYRALQSCIDND